MYILHHTNIVELFAVISEPGHYGIVMEYVLHGALDDYIHDNSVCCLFSGFRNSYSYFFRLALVIAHLLPLFFS